MIIKVQLVNASVQAVKFTTLTCNKVYNGKSRTKGTIHLLCLQKMQYQMKTQESDDRNCACDECYYKQQWPIGANSIIFNYIPSYPQHQMQLLHWLAQLHTLHLSNCFTISGSQTALASSTEPPFSNFCKAVRIAYGHNFNHKNQDFTQRIVNNEVINSNQMSLNDQLCTSTEPSTLPCVMVLSMCLVPYA